MKKIYTVFVFNLIFIHSTFAVKGMYVDGFASILGNTNKEDSLLNYAQQNGFTYLTLYELHLVHAAHDLTTVGTSAPMADFISRAKTIYGIQEIGACGENFWMFDNIISVYNSIHPNANEQFDVYNLEFEFWNTGSVGPGDYYCTTYLMPNGYSCDTAGAFAFYMKELTSIDSLADIDGTISEIYVGWFNQHQATQMKAKADRILLHSYVTDVNNVYAYAQTRLNYLGSTPGSVDVMPIFSSEPSFLGPWLVNNPEENVYPIYTAGLNDETGPWESNINLIGYQWFTYSFMPYGLPMDITEEPIDMNIYPNPFFDRLQIENKAQQNIDVKIYNMQGQLSFGTNSSDYIIDICSDNMAPGFYLLHLKIGDQIFSKRLIKP